MNYEEKIDNLLEMMLKEDWMDTQDWNETLETLYYYFPKEHLIKQLKEGEDNGYSIEQQLEIIKNIFRNGD